MKSHLYFVCPTDNLETVIDGKFRAENYYLTSLGNSVVFTEEVIKEIRSLVEAKNITEITFALSDDNQIVADALNGRVFTGIRGLDHFYDEITAHRKWAKSLWQTENLSGPVLSFYLQGRVDELNVKLSEYPVERIKLNTKIYRRNRNTFSGFPADLFRQGVCRLN